MFTLDAELGSERDNFKDQEKKELEDSIINCRKSENADMQDKVRCISNEDAIKVIQDFEQIIPNKKSYIVHLALHFQLKKRL